MKTTQRPRRPRVTNSDVATANASTRQEQDDMLLILAMLQDQHAPDGYVNLFTLKETLR